MKRIYLIFSALVLTLNVVAQPSWAKKTSKAIFSLKTFDSKGTLHESACGFFVGSAGEAVSTYTPFRGASRAVIIDVDGKEYPVECILGADETYDVIRFRVADIKKNPVLLLAEETSPVGATVWIQPYREIKKLAHGKVRKAEKFQGEYNYYTASALMPDQVEGCPLLNENGQVVGLMQRPSRQDDTLSYAVSVHFANNLRIGGLSINDPVMRATRIKKDLPDALDQALLTLYVAASSVDSTGYAQLVADFITKFPASPDGYQYRAQLALQANDFSSAQRDMEIALKVAEKKDEVHYSYARMIYQKEIHQAAIPYEPWSLEKALEEADAAYAILPLPVYRQQKALILFSQKRFAEASDIYSDLASSSLRSPELMYEASRCRQMLGDTLGRLALLDSAVAMFNRPLLKEAAPYLMLRAQLRMEIGRYRDAVADLNDYEELMKAHLSANFYYLRFQAEREGRLYQQALNDINQALTMTPDNDIYLAEKASLLVRVGLYDDAIEAATACVLQSPDYSDGYLFLGLAQCLKGNKADGMKNLQKAKEFGDTQADILIKKYAK